MDGEETGLFDDPEPRAVSLRWVWPGRWLLVIGDSMSVVLTGAEVGVLVDEVGREMGRIDGGSGG